METNASKIFLANCNDKGKVAQGVSKLKTQGTIKSNIPISFIS